MSTTGKTAPPTQEDAKDAEIRRLNAQLEAMKQDEPGRVIKPPKPEPFEGNSRDVLPFITRCKTYFRFFPVSMAYPEGRVLLAAGRLRGNASTWFEPILRDFLDEEPSKQDDETKKIFGDWGEFEKAIKDAFGLVNEEREAAARLRQMRQKGSAAEHCATFRQIAALTDWEDEPLMEILYHTLKSEVKDELYKDDRPDTLAEYMTMAIKIDQRQYERRRERLWEQKKNPNYAPTYFKRNKPNQGIRRNHGSTAYGTHPGRMELDNMNRQKREPRDMSKVKCYNCNEFGHMSNTCSKPKKVRFQKGAKQLNMIEKKDDNHVGMSWTACYDDGCLTYKSSKDGAGWYPQRPKRQLNMMSVNRPPANDRMN